jgi:phage terminase small subunit
VHKKNKGLTQKRNPKRNMDQAFTTKFKNFRNKRKFGLRKKPNQEKDMSKIQCFNCRKYGHYRNHYPDLKKRKDTDEATVVEERELSKKSKQDKTDFFF